MTLPDNLDALVDEFDAAWHAGGSPSIDEFLNRFTGQNHDQLLEQLLPIDIEYRLKSGKEVSAEAYNRFGENAVGIATETIENAEQLLESSTGVGGSSVNRDATNDDIAIPPKNDPNATIPQYNSENGGDHEPQLIDQYKLIEKIGEGGMGSVWLAEQQEPVVRKVALKLIRADIGSREAIARFEAERQALAMMDSDNIAKVLDGGTAANGSPYFVMELVSGVPLNEYCDQKKLSIRERLQLMVDISSAIQHAHQKGIIHRDLKPSNVLVTENNGKPVPKVIDFGLAKALEHTTRLTDKTMNTEFGQVVGTLQYMSPEQAAMDSVDIDTRTDIYSLGVMMYELLTGSTPLEAESLKKNALLQILELIREKEPPRPSFRLSSAGYSIEDVSVVRQISSSKLRQILRGDLDWIVMRAIEKDRIRRYTTASGFADDIQRFLNHEPVNARPPSASYRIQKFVRKNRGLVASAATIAALLLAGIGGTTWGLIQANQQAAEAVDARNEAIQQKRVANENAEQSKKDKLAAVKSAKRSQDSLKIFADSFRSVDPLRGANADMLARDVLLRAKESLEDSELDDEGKAELLSALTLSFLGVGEYATAISTAQAEVDFRITQLGPHHPDTLAAMGNLAASFRRDGQTDLALKLDEELFERRKVNLGLDHRETLASMNGLVESCFLSGQTKRAIELGQELLELRKTNLGPSHKDTLSAMSILSLCYRRAGRNDKALELGREVLELMRNSLGPEHPTALVAMGNLATSYSLAGQNSQAFKLGKDVLSLVKTKMGVDHPHTITAMGNLASFYRRAKQTDNALKLDQKVFELVEPKLGSDHPKTLTAKANLAASYESAGKNDKARMLYHEVIDLMKTKLGPDHPRTLSAMQNLAIIYYRSGKADQAIELGRDVVTLRKDKLGSEHPDTLVAMKTLRASYNRARQFEQAATIGQELFEISKTKLGHEHPRTQSAKLSLATSYSWSGQAVQAIKLSQEVVDWRSKKLGQNHPETVAAIEILAMSYKEADKLDEAVSAYEKLVELSTKSLGRANRTTQMRVAVLGANYKESERFDKAILLLEEASKSLGKISSFRWVESQLRDAYVKGQRVEKLENLVERSIVRIRGKSDGEMLRNELGKCGYALFQVKAYAKAEKLLQEHHDLLLEEDPDSWQAFNSLSLLGAAKFKLGKHGQAKPLLTNGFEGLEGKMELIPADLRESPLTRAIDWLIEFSKATENEEDLNRWNAKKEQLTKEHFSIEKTKPN